MRRTVLEVGPLAVKRWWLIIGFVALAAGGAWGIKVVNDTAQDNRDLVCSIANLISRSPIQQLPDETEAEFRKRLGVYREFVIDLTTQSAGDCGEGVTKRLREKLRHAKKIRRSIPKPNEQGSITPKGGGRSTGSSPPSTPGSGSIPAPPAPSPPPGSPNPPPEPQPPGNPQPPPKPPSPPPSPPPKPPPKPDCILNPAGICVPNPLP